MHAALIRAVAEIIKQRNAVRFCPDPNLARVSQTVVGRLNDLLAVERHDELVPTEVHPERMPLIRKFIDPEAEFIFVPGDQVAAKAGELGAVSFDIDGCELGHHDEDVSFNSILKKYRLDDPALLLLGEIVRAADSHPSKPHPAGESLRWVAFGFSALGLSDHDILDREFIV